MMPIEKERQYLCTRGQASFVVETLWTRDGRVWLCRDRNGAVFCIRASELKALEPAQPGAAPSGARV